MKTMELVLADILAPDQLLENDLIRHEDEIVTIKKIESIDSGWLVIATNDFDEEIEIEFADDAKISWYVFSQV